jgi:predicted nucleotidyltransferase
MNLQKDLREFVELLNELDVHFVVVGAFAVAYHGYARYTADIDLFVENSEENAERLLKAIHQFGFGSVGLTKEDFLQDDRVIQLGVAPNRLDLMTHISGVKFADAWDSREFGDIGGLRVPFISRDLLKRNKAATGRTQDLADLEQL